MGTDFVVTLCLRQFLSLQISLFFIVEVKSARIDFVNYEKNSVCLQVFNKFNLIFLYCVTNYICLRKAFFYFPSKSGFVKTPTSTQSHF